MNLLGKEEQQKLKEWDNETTRYFLILKSAGFKEAVSIVRKKHNLIGKWNRNIKDSLIRAELRSNSILNNDINLITDFYSIQRHFVETIVSGIGIQNLTILENYSTPIYTPPIADSGFYIKVSPITSKKKVLEAYEIIKSKFREWENDDEISGKPKIHDRSVKPRDITNKIKLFLAIEHMIYINYQDAKAGNYDANNESNYQAIYEEAARNIGYKLKKDKYGKTDTSRIKHIYLIEILKYYTLDRYENCQKLFENLTFHQTSK